MFQLIVFIILALTLTIGYIFLKKTYADQGVEFSLKALLSSDVNSVQSDNAVNVADFVPLADSHDFFVITKDAILVSYIAVGSLNYRLKKQDEQDVVESQ